MPLNLRSVVGQVHGISRSIGSRRNFSSSVDNFTELNGTKMSFKAWLFSRGLGLAFGFGLGHYTVSHMVSELVEKLEKGIEAEVGILVRKGKDGTVSES